MEQINSVVVNKFALNFAGDGIGFSAKEIIDFFSDYSQNIKPLNLYIFRPKRSELFEEAVFQLKPKEQYYALVELASCEHASKNPYPSKAVRKKLLEELHSSVSPDPLGIQISQLKEIEYRRAWLKSINRVNVNTSASITSARTMLETVFKTIIKERGESPDNSGNLGKLLKQAELILNFNKAKFPSEHQILKGFISIINGVSSVSNNAGDRHGNVMGIELDNPLIANLIINSVGTICITFIELHLLTPINCNNNINESL